MTRTLRMPGGSGHILYIRILCRLRGRGAERSDAALRMLPVALVLIRHMERDSKPAGSKMIKQHTGRGSYRLAPDHDGRVRRCYERGGPVPWLTQPRREAGCHPSPPGCPAAASLFEWQPRESPRSGGAAALKPATAMFPTAASLDPLKNDVWNLKLRLALMSNAQLVRTHGCWTQAGRLEATRIHS